MERISKILLIAGLVLVLTAPGLALAQRPSLDVPCCPAPVIDGMIDEVWDCGVLVELAGGRDQNTIEVQNYLGYRVGAEALMMHNGDHLYIILGEGWEAYNNEVIPTAIDGPYPLSLFHLSFEDDPPLWDWNLKVPDTADEGFFQFLGYLPDEVMDAQGPDLTEYEFVAGTSESQFVGRIGGEHDPEFCRSDEPERPAPGVVSAFGAYFSAANADLGLLQDDERMADFVTVHEVAIDLRNAPLNLSPGDCYTSHFGSLPTFMWFMPENGNLSELVNGGAYSWPADFEECCFMGDPPLVDDFCDQCLPCNGLVCLERCPVEFVPEPGTLLLLSGGLMGLAGYASLRLRKR